MKPIIAALAAVIAAPCFAASPSAEQTDNIPTYVYVTYLRCSNGTVDRADDTAVKLYKPALNAMLASRAVSTWGWMAHNTGGEWTRAQYLTAPTATAAVAANLNLHVNIDRPKSKVAFDEACGSTEEYVWHLLAGNDANGRRGNAAFSTYYICDQSRERQADALVKRVFAPMYDRLVADGKLSSWGWAEHIIGGKYRRLATMTAPTVEALVAARESIVAAAEHDPLSDTLTSICGSHQDYIWDIKDQGP
jgi:hypothetical protein